MTWRKAETVPSIRDVKEITDIQEVQRKKSGTYIYSDAKDVVEFTASVPPQEGDFIVREDVDDIYHVPKSVFERKYNLIV